jgi:hypothetical protein
VAVRDDTQDIQGMSEHIRLACTCSTVGDTGLTHLQANTASPMPNSTGLKSIWMNKKPVNDVMTRMESTPVTQTCLDEAVAALAVTAK